MEDESTVSQKLKTIFSNYGCLVHIVQNQEECLNKAPHLVLDLIILRHFMNGTNTEDLADRLKNTTKFHHVPIIVYDNIGKTVVEEKESTFVLNKEGDKVIERAASLLKLTLRKQ